MKVLIIIPVYNEEKHIISCLESLYSQSFQEFSAVVVDDGSTDSTHQLVANFIEDKKMRFSLVSNQKSKENTHQPGAKVVNAFNFGLNIQNLNNFDIICKFDADILFPENYLEKIVRVYQENPKAGMVSGLVYIQKNGEWQFENLSSREHIRGPIKSYRKDCFLKMKGLRAILGWDNIDVMLAKMHGWETVTIKDLWVKHLRPTAYKYKHQKAEKLGEYFYNIGLSFPLALISSLKSSFKNRSFSEFWITMKSFLSQKHPLLLTSQEIKYIRNLRWKQMLNRWK